MIFSINSITMAQTCPNHVLPRTSFLIDATGLDGVPLPLAGADDELELGGPGSAPVGKCGM